MNFGPSCRVLSHKAGTFTLVESAVYPYYYLILPMRFFISWHNVFVFRTLKMHVS